MLVMNDLPRSWIENHIACFRVHVVASAISFFSCCGCSAGSGVVRIDPLRFPAGCRKRRLNQSLSASLVALFFYCVVVYWGTFYVSLVFIGMCSVS